MSLTVIGIGKLGLCTALCLESAGYTVVGVDIQESYVNQINTKTLKTSEPYVEEFLKKSTRLRATTKIEEGLAHSNLIFIVVQTPTGEKGYDHSILSGVLSKINSYKVKNKHIVICCTVLPGYIETIGKSLLEDCRNITLNYNPEFIAQGSIIANFLNPDMVLIGQDNDLAGQAIEDVYRKLCPNSPTCRMSVQSAEIAKLAVNCFLTTKIAFANMIGDIADSTQGADKIAILNAVGLDSRIGNKYLSYGFGYGGPCLPRDNRALIQHAKSIGIAPHIPEATDISNREHTEFQLREFMEIQGPVMMSNLIYKKGVPSIEESQQLLIAEKLARKGRSVIINEPPEVALQIRQKYGDLFSYTGKRVQLSKIYISHYTKLTDRKGVMSLQAQTLKDWPVQWIDFFDREAITQEMVDKAYVYDRGLQVRVCTLAEIANALAHQYCIDEIANDPLIESGMIIEDDIMFKENFVTNLKNSLNSIPEDWDILAVGGCYRGGPDDCEKTEFEPAKDFILYIPTRPCLPTGNYIVTKKAAKKIVKHKLYRPFSMPIDANLCAIATALNLRVYWCKPWLSFEGSKNGTYESVAGRGF